MRFALLTGDETPEDLRELMANLRERQRRCQIDSTRVAISQDLDEVLTLLEAMDALGSQPAH